MPELTIQQAFKLANEHHRAGRMREAEELYRQILAHDPSHLPTLQSLAQLRFQIGQPAGAIELLRRAVSLQPGSADLHGNLGMLLATTGQVDEAIAQFRLALALRPGAEAHNNLGNALQTRGLFDEAAGEYRQALALRSDYPDAHNNLAIVLRRQGHIDEAIAEFRKALALRPGYVDARYNLGLAFRDSGRLDEAMAEYRRVLSEMPARADAAVELGNALQDLKQWDEALAVYRQALSHRPDSPELHYAVGNVLKHEGDPQAALAAYQQALQLRPDYAEAHNNLGNALKDLGRMDEALAAYHRAATSKPDLPEARNNLGFALHEKGYLDDAIRELRQALALRPEYPEALNNLGNVLKEKGQLDEAIAAYSKAISLGTEYPDPDNNLANALKDTGHLDEALTHYRRAIEMGGGATAHSNLLFALYAHPDYGPARLFEEHAEWNRTHARPLAVSIPAHSNDRSPERRLRIGYVSPDFTEHPVGRFFQPLLANHDRRQFEIFCYADLRRRDTNTERLRGACDVWRETLGLKDEQLADRIREDRIDVLVDLTAHASGNRMLLFARKPAPVQVTWLAYCGTTGLETMDYRLSDPYFDPSGADEQYYSETTVRLPRTYWCYQPLPIAPPLGPLPALAAGHISFGCLNNTWKPTTPALAAWWRLMRQVPGSQLIAHFHEGSQRREIAEQAQAEGIDPGRLQFVGRMPATQYLEQYNRIDIALDPFPYPGGTTSCDALWMGTPVVSLAGQTAVSRAGLSILSNIGLPELVAHDPDEYVRIASGLASDLPRLQELRSTLRDRMQRSPLMDAPGFARDIEAAYRRMWINLCSLHMQPEKAAPQ